MKRLPAAVFTLLAVFLLAAAGIAEDRRGPFVHPPRSVRGRDFDQRHVRLELTFSLEDQKFTGRVVHRLVPFVPLGSIELDAAEMKVFKVVLADDRGHKLKGTGPLEFTHRGDRLSVTLDRAYLPSETIGLAIDYLVSQPEHGVHFVLPEVTEPDRPRMIWTQSEPEYARYWFPCFDSPNDRITSEILATVPDDFLVLSNGILKEKKDNGNGTRRWHWVQEQSHVTYLMSVVAGRFDAFEQSWKGIPVVSYVPQGRLSEAERSFEKTPAMIGFFSQISGYPYPWPKYSQICVEEYGWGGMEHTTATTLNVTTLHDARAHLDHTSDGLVAHELVHHWYGDLITCKDWAEIWLNESFATYFTTLWVEHDQGADEAVWRLHGEAESYFTEDAKRYRRPIVTYRYPTPGRMFDRHSYPKGARVLHMLRFVLGDDEFFKALRHYTKKHEFTTVETAQFRIAVEEATGQGLNWFFDQWLYHGGHPEYHVSHDWDAKQKSLRMTVKQTQKVDDLTPLFRMPIEIELVTPDETIVRKVTVSKAEQTFDFTLKQRPLRVCFDPNDWVLKKLTAHKSREEWLDQLANSARVICRARAVQGLREFNKDEDVAAALAEAAAKDPFWGVRQEAAKALAKFPGDGTRKALLGAAKSDPKSFVRRAAVKSLADFPHDETQAALREIVKSDRSYETAAEALRSLVKVDRANCRDDLLGALAVKSHREVILRAAADGLADLNDPVAASKLTAMLDSPTTADRRIAVLRALARLLGDGPGTLEILGRHLNDPHSEIRTAACEALAATGDPAAIDLLTARREKEENARMIQTIDDNLAKLRDKQTQLGKLRKDLDATKREDRKLRDRIKKLEDAAKE
jgi:aminopeptidase N